ncbi:ABC transporter substrate-binding protein [Belnapia rosea]|uniref:ABC transporter substrate-binding protein n=1 Tax=Belnapia rosea TaxID=938405 RepID=UPI00088660E9|nr:ABC transporter substrate-binding protein [Belnapia rosea]SDB74397.1 ABC-type nitrate/sulfonate/bicarbonate transport system, substrate-binding protein [Belnapia rosea]
MVEARHPATPMVATRRHLLACAASSAASLAQPALAQARQTVVFGIGLSAPFAPYVVLVESGIGAKHGIRGEYKIFESGIGGIEAVVTGNAQVAAGSELTPLRARASGAKIRAVGRPLISGKDIGIGVNAAIRSPQDFKGKRIGTIRGGTGDYLLYRFREKHGLHEGTDPDGYRVTNVNPAEWIPALSRGDIDAFFGWEPWVSRLPTVVRNARAYGFSGDDDLYWMWYSLIFREEWIRDDPAAADATYLALAETMDWINANREDACRMASKAFRVPIDAMRNQMNGCEYLLDTKRVHLTRLKEVGAWAAEAGFMQTSDLSRLVDEFYDPTVAQRVAPQRTDF